MRIALLVPTTSRGRPWRDLSEADLLRVLLPSLVATADWSGEFAYELHVSVDADDAVFAGPGRPEALAGALRAAVGARPVTVTVQRLAGAAHAPCWHWNALFATAVAGGADYFYQLGDDVRFLTDGWARRFVAALSSRPRLPGIGVAGPLEVVNRRILTQAFVSRLHHEVFGTFFPARFRNWWSDDWITEVYRPDHLFACEDQWIENVGGSERYEIEREAEARLAAEVAAGRQRLGAWLRHREIGAE